MNSSLVKQMFQFHCIVSNSQTSALVIQRIRTKLQCSSHPHLIRPIFYFRLRQICFEHISCWYLSYSPLFSTLRASSTHEQHPAGLDRNTAVQQAQQFWFSPPLLLSLLPQPCPATSIIRDRHETRAQPLQLPQETR